MFFIISKIFAFLLLPYFWIMVILLWAIFTKKQPRRKWLIILIFISSYLLGNGFLQEEVIRKWEMPVTQESKLQGIYDIGIVLGGFSSYDTTNQRIQFYQSSDRLWQAFELYKTGKVKKLMISGGSGSLLHKEDTEGDRVKSFLLKLGMPAEDIMMESKSRNTRENAIETSHMLMETNPQARCLLITSAFHMRRALACFQKVHLNVTPYTTDFIAGRRRWDPDKLLIPSASCLDGWNLLLREILGYYTYRMMGYL